MQKQVKIIRKILSYLAATALLLSLAACGGAASSLSNSAAGSGSVSSQSENAAASGESEVAVVPTVYRGRVESISENSVTVAQLPGHDYGQQRIVFHMDDATQTDEEGIALAEDVFVEVWYNGVLTRSMPPQATAESLAVITAFSEGAVVNGAVISVAENDDGYVVGVLPFAAGAPPTTEQQQAAVSQDLNMLMVPKDALEGLAPEDLQEGALVSAVTRGIAALSLPPQTPVHALLPYT